MSIIHKILPRINVLYVVFSDGDYYGLRLVKCRYAKDGMIAEEIMEVSDPGSIRKELTVFPVFVLVSGYGVISKQIDIAGEIVAKVTADESGFLWTKTGNEISFVREEQLKVLNDILVENKSKVVIVECASFDKEAGEEKIKEMAVEHAGHFYADSVNVRTVLKPSAAGSVMARLITSKLRLLVLGFVLIALMVNAMVSPDVRTKYEAANAELSALRKTIGQADDVSRRRQEFIKEYDGTWTLPHRVSWLCDRVATVLPDGITLTFLSVQPPLRTVENNKKTTFAEKRIAISGESLGFDEISHYVTELNELSIASQVRLASIEQDRDGRLFNFKIVLEL